MAWATRIELRTGTAPGPAEMLRRWDCRRIIVRQVMKVFEVVF